MRIPLPVFYLAEDDAGNMVVVDGLQRLSTFQRFVNGELKLRLAIRLPPSAALLVNTLPVSDSCRAPKHPFADDGVGFLAGHFLARDEGRK